MHADIVVTVIICVHNGEKYLAHTLESVAKQTGLGIGGEGVEVIIIDDRSSDNSVDLIRRYASILESKGFSVQCILHSENKQTQISYTEGASLARGKYFKILDHDDTLASDRALAEPVEFMEAMESRGCLVGVVYSKTLYMDEQGAIFGEKHFPFPFLPFEAASGLIPKNWGQFVLVFSPLYPFVHGASVVRKACWQELSADYLAEHGAALFDVHFALHAMHSKNWRVGYLRDPSLQYRIHRSSFTQSQVKRDAWIEILNAQYEKIYGEGVLLTLIKSWTRCVQSMKGFYHRVKGVTAFKVIALFGKRN